MVEFKLLGEVRPEWLATVSLVQAPVLVLHRDQMEREYTVAIQEGQITVLIRCTEEFSERLLNEARIDATEVVGGILGLLSFMTGMPYSLTFETCIPPGETEAQPLVLLNPELAVLCTALSPDNNSAVLHMVLGDYGLLQIFNDLSMAITRVQYQPIACGRVLDGIRNYLAPWSAEKNKQRQGFEEVARLLNLSDDYARIVTDIAKKPRHREKHDLSSEDVGVALRRTWAVTNRFLEHLKRGRTPLSAPEFPLL